MECLLEDPGIYLDELQHKLYQHCPVNSWKTPVATMSTRGIEDIDICAGTTNGEIFSLFFGEMHLCQYYSHSMAVILGQ